MSAADAAFLGIVNGSILHPSTMQFFNSLLCFFPEVFYFAELDGLGRAGLCTSWLKPYFLSVMTERAFESTTVFRITLYYTERTRRHAVSAAVANIRLDEHSTEFSAHNGTGGAGFQAACIFAVFADI